MKVLTERYDQQAVNGEVISLENQSEVVRDEYPPLPDPDVGADAYGFGRGVHGDFLVTVAGRVSVRKSMMGAVNDRRQSAWPNTRSRRRMT